MNEDQVMWHIESCHSFGCTSAFYCEEKKTQHIFYLSAYLFYVIIFSVDPIEDLHL